jgi:hypothetical protein
MARPPLQSAQLPAALVERLLAHERSTQESRPALTGQEKVVITSALVLVAAVVAAFSLRGAREYHLVPVGLALVSQLMAGVAVAIVPLWEVVPFIRDPVGALTHPIRRHFESDTREILALAQKYEQHELEYAHEVLWRTAADFGDRVALIAGPRLGLGPALVLLYFFITDKVVGLPYAGQWGLYLPIAAGALLMSAAQIKCQRLGRLALLARHAAACKQRGARAWGSGTSRTGS